MPPAENGQQVELEKGPNIKSLPELDPLPGKLELPVLIKVGDDISTDEIMPAGAKILPYRSNIPEISKFVFSQVDKNYYNRAIEYQDQGSLIVGGENYGQGSSREHAAIAPRYLGVRAVIAKSFARIHWQNLANFGVLPLTFAQPDDWKKIDQGDVVAIKDVRSTLKNGNSISVTNVTKDETYQTQHTLSKRQVEMILDGSLINLVRAEQ